MVAYRHGLRAKEAAELEWTQVEFGRSASLHVRRAKKGRPSVRPIVITVAKIAKPARRRLAQHDLALAVISTGRL
jgi:hypothetical protein